MSRGGCRSRRWRHVGVGFSKNYAFNSIENWGKFSINNSYNPFNTLILAPSCCSLCLSLAWHTATHPHTHSLTPSHFCQPFFGEFFESENGNQHKSMKMFNEIWNAPFRADNNIIPNLCTNVDSFDGALTHAQSVTVYCVVLSDTAVSLLRKCVRACLIYQHCDVTARRSLFKYWTSHPINHSHTAKHTHTNLIALHI